MYLIMSSPRGSPVNDTKKKQYAGAVAINMHLVNAQPGVRSVLNALARIILLENADQREGFMK